MITPCPATLTKSDVLGVDDDPFSLLPFSVLFPEWVTSAKRYWFTSA